ncbi:MAG TPA: hypothetical protein VMR43_14420 [Variovorax sp.]|nr:hypothetical protein [Variovorax sp.]
MRIHRPLTFLLLAGLPVWAPAQAPASRQPEAPGAAVEAGTLYVRHHRETIEGRLSACGLEFAAVAIDHSTRQGAPVKLAGRYELRAWPQGGPGYSLKLGLYDGLTWDHPVAPHNASVRAPRGPVSRRPLRLDAANPGHALFFDALDDTFAATFRSIVEDRTFVIAFNRAAGEQDVTATIDVQVAGTRTQDGRTVQELTTETGDDFRTCASELFKTFSRLPPATRPSRGL